MTSQTAPDSRRISWSRMKSLLGMQRRELLRDGRSFWFSFLFPFAILGLFLLIFGSIDAYSGGEGAVDQIIAMSLFMAVTSIAFTATASPLATLRRDGVLRLLSTTPVSRAEFLITHIPVRLVLVAFQTLVILLLGWLLDAFSLRVIPAAVGVSLLGMVLFGSLGYLLGGVLPGPDAASNLGTLVQLLAFFLSGLVFPLEAFPAQLESLLTYMPFTFFADLLLSVLTGIPAVHPVWLSVMVVLGTSLVFSFVAARIFRWEE